MVSRRRGVVDSQQDVRQTAFLPDLQFKEVSRASAFCAVCKICGCKFGCLTETPPLLGISSRLNGKSSHFDGHLIQKADDWSPSLGPCCEDCFELLKAKAVTSENETDRDLTGEKGEGHSKSLIKHLWETMCGLLHAVQGVFSKQQVSFMDGVQPEAEGFLELQVVVSRYGWMQHLEIDFPADIRITLLKEELASLIDVPGPAQHWFHLAVELDDDKTLEEAAVDTGAVIEVKCMDLH